MSNHEERRKSLITLSSVIQAADDSKYKQSLDECENECSILKNRIKALESLLADSGVRLLNYLSVCPSGLERSKIRKNIKCIDAILPAKEGDK